MIIYLIDDDAEEAELFNDAIERINEEATVRSFSNGKDALSLLSVKDETPDVIFLDLNMPMFSGKEVLKEIRSNRRTSTVPVIIYSTTISKRDIEETSAYNVKAYLEKPEDFASLCKKLAEQLRSI